MTPKSSAGATPFVQTSEHAVRTGKQAQNLSESKNNAILHFHTFKVQRIHFG